MVTRGNSLKSILKPTSKMVTRFGNSWQLVATRGTDLIEITKSLYTAGIRE